MKCRACESSNRPGARFCHRCSAPLTPSCIGCGALLTTAGQMCPACRSESDPKLITGEMFVVDQPTLERDLPVYGKAPYTGRDQVIEQLINAHNSAIAVPNLRFVVLVGEPGMGKSRTLKELARRLKSDQSHSRILIGCGERGAKRFGPFAQLLTSRFGVTPSEPASVSRNKISAEISELLPATKVVEVAHLLAHLMGVSFPNSPIIEALSSTPRQLEARIFIALRKFLAADAAAGPLVLCLENLELCGAETINLLHYLGAGLSRSPIFMVTTARSLLFERHPSFGEGDVELEQIILGPLPPDEALALWAKLTPSLAHCPESIRSHIQTLDGSPRAIYDLLHYLHESKIITTTPSGWHLDQQRLTTSPLPRTHEQLIAKRVEVMEPSVRDILEKAAIVGESFWLDAVVSLLRADTFSGAPDKDPDGPTLAAISAAGDHTRTQVSTLLGRLIEREWLTESQHTSVAGEREFRFTSPYLWSAVYDNIPSDQRLHYHRLVAQWLELRPQGRSAPSQEDVAAHLELAGLASPASLRYRRAADMSRASFHNDAAIRLYARALSCLGDSDLVARIHLWHDLGSVYELVGDYEAALGCFERMLRLSWVGASRTKAAVAFNKMGRVWRLKGDLKLALDYLKRGHQLFEQARDQRGIASSLDDIGKALYHLGRYDEAFEKVTTALSLRGKGGDPRSIAHSLSNLGIIQKDRGNPTEALNCHQEALKLRRSAGDRSGVITSLNNLAVLSYERGDLNEAQRGWEQALREAEEIGALPLQALALCNLGELAFSQDRIDTARNWLEEGLDLAEEVDDRRVQVEATRNLALLEQTAGDSVRARELALHAHQVAAEAGLREFEGRTLLTLGEIFGDARLDTGGTAAPDRGAGNPSAEGFFTRGIILLREIGNDTELAKGLEAFGRHKIERNELDDGRLMLNEALRLFERLGVPRSAKVKALLDTLY